MGRVGSLHKHPDRLLWSFIVFSAALHLFLIVFGGRFWSSKKRIEPIEITVRTEPMEIPVRSNDPAKRIIPKPPILAPLPETLRQAVPLKPLPTPVARVDQATAKERPAKNNLASVPALKYSKPLPPNPATKPEQQATCPTVKTDPSARDNYFRTVRMLVEHQKRYPKPARLRKFQGKVIIECVLAPSGEVNSIRVAQGSSFGILDRAAVKAIEDAAPFPKPPPGLFSEDGIRLKIALVYRLG